ncbi:endoribonuclease Dicer-like [Dendronephthya gigantea]|uniref:endoribonuclease Dicer-like n=1 Tax=Dendronephthya gigantea TaxID=151771 RepID=UPI001069E296|nr:endoribonuclease Dicer-like [Dendronephthya gigantea]
MVKTNPSEMLGLPVLALKRPHHEVELFDFAFQNDCALVISKRTSRDFLCYELVNEFLQNESGKWTVVVYDDNSGLDVKPLLKIFRNLMPQKPVLSLNKASRLSQETNYGILLTSANHFEDHLSSGYVCANEISVIILLTTLQAATAIQTKPKFLEMLCNEHAKPRIIAMVQLDLCEIYNALDLRTELEYFESTYDLQIFISNDLLAMNAFGEEISVEMIPFSPKNLNKIEIKVWRILKDISNFLQDVNVPVVSKSVETVRSIVSWAVKILTMFGLWSLSFTLETIQNTLSKLLSKENDQLVVLAIEMCKRSFDNVQKFNLDQSGLKPAHSRLMYEILDQLIPYKVLCKLPAIIENESDLGLSGEQKPSASDIEIEKWQTFTEDCEGEGNSSGKVVDNKCHPAEEKDTNFQHKGATIDNSFSSHPEVVKKQLQKLKTKSQFHCIIVTKSNSHARMLSKLINYMSCSNQKYGFLKSGCVIHSKNGNPDEEERTESVLQAVLQGMVNILVTTLELCADLSLTTFNVLIYFGVPGSYEEFYNIKHKIKGLAPKLMLVFDDDKSNKCERNLKVFTDIEAEFAKSVSDYTLQVKKQEILTRLSEEQQCIYAPYGDNGPSVSMESSVHLVNRYSRRISRGDFCNLYAKFKTEKKHLKQNVVEFLTKLYLPLGSCCNIVEGSPVRVTGGDDLDTEAGVIKSRMLASLEFVKILHANGKMDNDLDLIEEVYVDANDGNEQNFELEDEGKGRAGTNKRKRAYGIKVPSFFEDNMPRANEPCFLYKIEFQDPTIYKHSRSGSLQSLSEPEFELGILSRKPLPKILPFFVHTCKSDVKVSLEVSGPVAIDEMTLICARLFHHYVFKELHKMDHQTTTLSENDGYLAVPLLSKKTRPFNTHPSFTQSRVTPSETPQSPQTTAISCRDGFEIHHKFLKEFSSFFESVSDPNVILKSSPPYKDFGFFQNKIVRRLNESATQAHYTRYFVVKVCDDLSPSSPFPDEEVAASFAEYYDNRYGIQVCLEQPLLLVQHLPTQVNFILPRLRHSEDTEVIPKVTKREIHLIPELCSILPLSASAWSLARFFPAVVCRLETLLRAHEMKMKILSGTGIRANARSWNEEGNWDNGKLLGCGNAVEKSLVGDGNCDGHDIVGIDDDGELNGGASFGPSISSVLHALTAKSAGQQYHSERLEILGDSCLKLEVSLDLFLTDPEKDEWTLSVYRKQLVSNDMLSTQGRRLGMSGYISITPPDLTNTSLPPGFNLRPANETKRSKKESLNLYNHQVLGDKHVANCVEALIAATLLGCGRNAARQFMIWLGVTRCTFSELDVLYRGLLVQTTERDQVHARNLQENLNCADQVKFDRKLYQNLPNYNRKGTDVRARKEHEILADARLNDECNGLFEETPLTSAGLGKAKDGHGNLLKNSDTHLKNDTPRRPMPNFDHIEKELGYCFKNKLLLLQTLTHNTYPRSLSLVSETYQKMEFLGDAILDYVITLYLYEHFPHLTHGDVTDFRSALVNNFTLAFLAVQKNLHQSLRYMSPALLDMIAQFVEFLEKQKLKQGASWKTSIDAFVVSMPEVEESVVEVPKILGDVFEAVVCAVFLDSGMNLELVWRVFYPMFMPFIDYYKNNIPRSPIRDLKESFPESHEVVFSLARLTLSRKYKSSVDVVGYGKFEAVGRTPKIAKTSVARKALEHIRNVKTGKIY